MTGPQLDPALRAWADRNRDGGDQPDPLFDVTREPARPAGPRTWPGGVQVIGPLLRIPGRTIHVDDLDEADEHAASVVEAIAELRAEFDPARPGRPAV